MKFEKNEVSVVHACTRMYIQKAVLGIRFEHTYFGSYIFFTARLFTYIKTNQTCVI